jgi:hypothetical protein
MMAVHFSNETRYSIIWLTEPTDVGGFENRELINNLNSEGVFH